MHLVESFHLAHLITCPTHNPGHTLDLVLSFSSSICNMEIIDARLSDNSDVVFDSLLPFSPPKSHLPVRTIPAHLSPEVLISLIYPPPPP